MFNQLKMINEVIIIIPRIFKEEEIEELYFNNEMYMVE